MSAKQRLMRSLAKQFGNPHGALGRVAGWVMGRRTSNVRRSRWAVELLDLQPGERLLEVGCGPGVAIAAAASRGIAVVGVDRSAVMIGQARRRNNAAVRAGRVELVTAPVEDLPDFDKPFDKVLAVNTVGHWDDPLGGLTALRRVLRSGGRIAIVTQPRHAGATAADSLAAADTTIGLLGEAGFDDVRIETLELDPPAVCALATNP
ncbi:MAG TPA: methyltransferase domain-containing protein [Ilumatobacteraceae bacterium]|nr:methyltransferase domain-containing protein [Ilumatobacteraceae bacterium]